MVYPRKPPNEEDGKSVERGRQDAEAIHLGAKKILEQKLQMLKARIGQPKSRGRSACATGRENYS
jgi:hypothetical protein